jgi:hypothetical protein
MTGATGVYSSTIVSRTLTIDGQTISGTSGTTAIITGSGTLVLTGTVVDSRGRIGTRTANITILPYAPPLVSTFTVKRATSGGTIDPNGTYFSINLIAAVQSLIVGTQKNSIDYKFKRQPRGGTTAWSAVTADVSTHVSSTGVSTTILPGTYSIANSYDVRIEVTDALGVTTAVQGTVSTGGVLMNWSTTYDGIGVGKYWSQGSIDALSQIYQNNGNAVIDITNTATTAVFGIVKLASDSDAVTGTDTARAVTPHADAAALAAADKAWGLPTFASSAARDTFYGTAAQGQRCIRSDKGWVEMYYALYNSGTNPGGASVAGWYPIAGLLPVVEHADTSNLALTTSATTVTSWTETYRRNASSISSGVWTCAQAGRYLVNVFINMGASVSSATNLLLNGSAPVITGDTDGGGSTLGGYNTLTAEVNMAVGDTLEVHATRSAGNATDRRWSISYIRPY